MIYGDKFKCVLICMPPFFGRISQWYRENNCLVNLTGQDLSDVRVGYLVSSSFVILLVFGTSKFKVLICQTVLHMIP